MAATSKVSESTKPESGFGWQERALSDLQSVPRVRTVLLTDRKGNIVQVVSPEKNHHNEAEAIDVLLGATEQAMEQLEMGHVRVLASICARGMLIVASSDSAQVSVLAEPEANLGSLLNHVRRVFPGEH